MHAIYHRSRPKVAEPRRTRLANLGGLPKLRKVASAANYSFAYLPDDGLEAERPCDSRQSEDHAYERDRPGIAQDESQHRVDAGVVGGGSNSPVGF